MSVKRLPRSHSRRFVPDGGIVVSSPSAAMLAEAKALAEVEAARLGCVIAWQPSDEETTARGDVRPIAKA